MQHDTDSECPVCPECGRRLDRGARFCGSCGAALSTDSPEGVEWKDLTLGTCPACLNPIPFDRHYCILCGKKLHDTEDLSDQTERFERVRRLNDCKKNGSETTLCRRCGAPLDDDASFCGACGAYIFPKDESLSCSDAWKEQPLDVCPLCAQIVPAGRHYCIFCGGSLYLSKDQWKDVKAERAQHLRCRISFCIADLTEHEIGLFYRYLSRTRTYSDRFLAKRDRTVDCEFTLSFDEIGNAFHKEIAANMIRLLLEDAAKAFPQLQATANCHYESSYLVRSGLCPFGDLGGFISISLSDGEVTVDDTPYM